MSWECDGCTMVNDEESETCEVCGDPRDGDAASPQPPSESGSGVTVPQVAASPRSEPPASPAPIRQLSFGGSAGAARQGSVASNASFASRADDAAYTKLKKELEDARSDARAAERAKADAVQHLERQVAHLRASVEQLTDEAAEQAKAAAAFEKAEKKLRREAETKEKKIAHLTEDLDKVDEAYRKHLRESAGELADVDKNKKAAKAAEDKIAAAVDKAAELTVKVSNLERDAAAHQAAAAEAAQKLSDAEAKHAEEIAQRRAAEADIGKADEVAAKLVQAEERAAALAASLAEAEVQQARLKDDAAGAAKDLEGKLAKSEVEAVEAKAAAEALRSDLLGAADERDSLKEMREALTAERDAALSTAKALEEQLAAKTTAAEAQAVALEAARGGEGAAAGALKELQAKLATSAAEAQEAQAAHAAELDALKKDLEAARGAMGDAQAEAAAKTAEAEAHLKALDAARGGEGAAADAMKELEVKLVQSEADAKAALAAHAAELNTLKKEGEAALAASAAQAEAAAATAKELEARLATSAAEAQEAQAAHAAELDALKKDLEAARGASAAAQAEAAAKAAEAEGLATDLEAVRGGEGAAGAAHEEALVALRGEVAALTGELQQAQAAAGAVGDQERLRARVVEVEGELAAARREVAELQTQAAGEAPLATPTTQQLQQQADRLRADLAAAQAGEAAARRAAEEARAREASFMGTLTTAASPEAVDALRGALEAKSKELTEALLRETKLRQEAAEGAPRDTDIVVAMKAEMARLQREVADGASHEAFLKDKLKGLEDAAAEAAGLRAALVQAEAQAVDAEKARELSASEREKKYRKELRELKKDLIAATKAGRQPPTIEEADASMEALADLRAQLSTSHSRLASQQEQLASHQEALAAKEEALAAEQEKLAATTSDAALLRARVDALEQQQLDSPIPTFGLSPPISPTSPLTSPAEDTAALKSELDAARGRERALEAELETLRALDALSPPPTRPAPSAPAPATPEAPGEDVMRSLQEQLVQTQDRAQAAQRQLDSAQKRIDELEAAPLPPSAAGADDAAALREQVAQLQEELEGRDPADWTPHPGEKGKDYYTAREKKFKKEIRELKKELLSAKSGSRRAGGSQSPASHALNTSVSSVAFSVGTAASPPLSPVSPTPSAAKPFPGPRGAPNTFEEALQALEEIEARHQALKKELREVKLADRMAEESRSRSADRMARQAAKGESNDVHERLAAAEELNKTLKRDNRAIKTELLKLKNSARKKAVDEKAAEAGSPEREREGEVVLAQARYKSISDLENRLRLAETKLVLTTSQLTDALGQVRDVSAERDDLLANCKSLLAEGSPFGSPMLSPQSPPGPDIGEVTEKFTQKLEASEERGRRLGEALRNADAANKAAAAQLKDAECKVVLLEGELTVWKRKGAAGTRDDELQAYKAKYLTALDRSKFLDSAVRQLQDETERTKVRAAQAAEEHAVKTARLQRDIWSLKNEVRAHEGLPQLAPPDWGRDRSPSPSPRAPPARSSSPMPSLAGLGASPLDASPQLLEAERKKVQKLQAELIQLQKTAEHTDAACLDTILRKGVIEAPKLIPEVGSPHHRGTQRSGLSPRAWSRLRGDMFHREPSPRTPRNDGDMATAYLRTGRTPRR